jgi:hypothetical protein
VEGSREEVERAFVQRKTVSASYSQSSESLECVQSTGLLIGNLTNNTRPYRKLIKETSRPQGSPKQLGKANSKDSHWVSSVSLVFARAWRLSRRGTSFQSNMTSRLLHVSFCFSLRTILPDALFSFISTELCVSDFALADTY